ncbi:hypothetical protein L7F22_008822 [Adiantum nelumboides]|nr:hypothetical protein [Adiantum nelumboides]
MLPTIPIDDCHYVMLNDIMELFDLREDYCLAIVAQNLQEDRSTIDPENDKCSIMDAHLTTGEFVKPIEALSMIFRDVAACAPTFPMESEFKEVQERLGIMEMGREAALMIMAPSSSSANNSSIDLWNAALIKEDENQKIYSCLVVYDDKFIPCPHGRGKGDLGKNSSLSQYLENLNTPKFHCSHSSYSEDKAEFPLFVSKTLSRYLGGEAIKCNTDKVMLLEKEATISTFGVGLGMYGLRSRCFLTHAAYGLSCRITNPRQLPQYRKHDLMKQKTPIIEHIKEAPQIEAIEKTQLLDLNVLATSADDETRHSKRPRHKERHKEEGPSDKGKRPKYFVTFLDND